jgi:hypothetical protein
MRSTMYRTALNPITRRSDSCGDPVPSDLTNHNALLARFERIQYPRETTEAFLNGHVSAFAFVGRVPCSILYDNTTIPVAASFEALNARRAEARATIGDANPLIALDARRTAFETELLAARSARRLAQRQVFLFHSLSGGWEDEVAPR